MLRDLRRYAIRVHQECRGTDSPGHLVSMPWLGITECMVQRGTVSEYRSLLILREAELTAVQADVTGSNRADCHTENLVAVLEIMIRDTRTWLEEAVACASPAGQ